MDKNKIRYWNILIWSFCTTKFLIKCYKNVIFLEKFLKFHMENCLKFCGLLPTYRCVTLTLHPKCGHSAIIPGLGLVHTAQ